MTLARIKFTKAEREQIAAGFRAIEHLSECTNWTDSGYLSDTYKMCRRDNCETQTEAQARIVKAWLEGARMIDADAPLSNYPWGYTEYYQRAFRLGCEQAIKHSSPNRSDYTSPIYDKAREIAAPAVTAWDAALQRWHDVPLSERMESE